jgi:hypothetical protein
MTEEEKRKSKRESAKKWREKNKEYISEKNKIYQKEYYYKNKIYVDNVLLSDDEKSDSRKESKFESWMSWENKGLYNGELNYGWDIDHIIPLSSADIEEDIIRLNHYTNLQPLCSKVNREIKKDKLDYEMA